MLAVVLELDVLVFRILDPVFLFETKNEKKKKKKKADYVLLNFSFFFF